VPYTVLRSINDIELMDHVKSFEKFIKYMYLDTTGNVTVGIGHRIANATEAKKLPFQIKDGKIWRNATEQEIADAYTKVNAEDYSQSKGHKKFDPEKNKDLDNLRIDKKTATEKALAHLRRDVASLRRKFSDFDSFPVPAQKALIDMNYNLGNDGFSRSPANSNRVGWPKLFDAVENRDWALVATESRRSGLGSQSDSTSRNGAIFNLFNQAAEIEPKEILEQDVPPRIE
jgi:GH24 family phage-related lysozyme (muramidase)